MSKYKYHGSISLFNKEQLGQIVPIPQAISHRRVAALGSDPYRSNPSTGHPYGSIFIAPFHASA